MPRISAETRGIYYNHYQRLLYTGYSNYEVFAGAGPSSTALRYRASPIVLPVNCRIDEIGILCSQANTGTILMGVHNSDTNDLPDELVCETAAQAMGAFAANTWSWIAPTTTPQVDSGHYYVGWIGSVDWADGVAGFRTFQRDCSRIGVFDVIYGIYRETVLVYSIPDPFVEVQESETWLMAMGLHVTVNP